MRLNLPAIATVRRLRRTGNARAYVLINLPSFWRGYALFVPLTGRRRRRWPVAVRWRR